jgi:putative transposase
MPINSMPRRARLDLPDIPQHIIQRGNDRQPCFFGQADYTRFRNSLQEIALDVGCVVHAYVLMTNHVHLLATPAEKGGVARMMRALGRRYVRYVNDTYHRTGTLWQGRYKACPVDSDAYLLQCYRYIELNPVRAAMVADPGEYPWFSFHANASQLGFNGAAEAI